MNRGAAGVAPPIAWGTVLCLCLFAVTHARPMPTGMLGPAALFGAAACLAYGVVRAQDGWRGAFGLSRPRSHVGPWLVAGAFIGVLLGGAYRTYKGLPPSPSALGGFAIMAATIGGIEELVYRGFIQTGLRRDGRVAAVAFAAAGHTAYKCLLFAWRPEVAAADFGFLAVSTFLAGILLGSLRETTHSVWPPVLAHAAFDLMLYGALDDAPWWVWG